MSRFLRRNTDLEIMDDLSTHGEDMDRTLREIDTINRWLGGNSVTLSGIGNLVNTHRRQLFTLCDLGCGSGEMLRLIREWGLRRNLDIRCTGVDANEYIAGYAQRHCKTDNRIAIAAGNVLSEEFFVQRYDFFTATLFLHHLTDEQLVSGLKRWTRMTNVGIVINDLHRHPLAYYAIKFITRILSRSSMVRHDAPLSVLRGFSRSDWIRILKDAGIERFKIRWKWAFRWQILIPAAVA